MTHRFTFAFLILAACAAPIAQPATTSVAERHAATVFTHCGFYEVDFAGMSWTPSSIERGSMPEGTDSMATEGTFELIGPDVVLFRANSGLEVRFMPAPEDLEPIPACD
jgi:hypothetical protein